MRPTLDYVEWDSERPGSEQPPQSHICELDDPFADRTVRQRTAEIIVRAVLETKRDAPVSG
jgi:hypothetical protein